MYEKWLQAPSSVHASWDSYFKTGDFQMPPAPGQPRFVASASATPGDMISKDSLKVLQMVRAFQVRGHLLANLDPLGLTPSRMNNQELQLEFYGFSEKDLDRMFDFTSMGAVSSLLGTSEGPVSLRHIYNRLREVYCGNIGYEYMHIPFTDECQWLRERIETQKKVVLSKEMKMSILSRLTWADHFENFLAKKFSAKRFGLEGGESTIPGLKAIITQASKMGCETVVMGMPHRGRLAVLATVVRKPVEKIFSEFAHVDNEAEMAVGSGDVKYTWGPHTIVKSQKRKRICISLCSRTPRISRLSILLSKARPALNSFTATTLTASAPCLCSSTETQPSLLKVWCTKPSA